MRGAICLVARVSYFCVRLCLTIQKSLSPVIIKLPSGEVPRHPIQQTTVDAAAIVVEIVLKEPHRGEQQIEESFLFRCISGDADEMGPHSLKLSAERHKTSPWAGDGRENDGRLNGCVFGPDVGQNRESADGGRGWEIVREWLVHVRLMIKAGAGIHEWCAVRGEVG